MRARLVPALAVAALALAACGSEDASDDAADSTDPSAESAESADDPTTDDATGADADGSEEAGDDGDSGDGAQAEGGSGGDGLATARVVEAVEAAGSARVVLTSTLEDADLTSEGVIDFREDYRLDVTTTIAAPEGDLSTRVVGISPDEIYVQLPEVPGWIAVADPDEAGVGIDVTGFADPDESWESWGSAGDLRRVGEEEVDGVTTTRYEVPDAALEDGVGSVDVWVDDEDLPVQVEVGVTDPTPSTIVIRYSDWGTSVEVTAPPADEIIEF